jgi:hypothetical protein
MAEGLGEEETAADYLYGNSYGLSMLGPAGTFVQSNKRVWLVSMDHKPGSCC